MEVQTDESFLRGCKSAADVTSVNNKYEHRAIIEKHVRRRIGDEDDIREIMSDEEFTSDLVSQFQHRLELIHLNRIKPRGS